MAATRKKKPAAKVKARKPARAAVRVVKKKPKKGAAAKAKPERRPLTAVSSLPDARPTPKRPQPPEHPALVPIHHFKKPRLVEPPALADVRVQVNQALASMRALETLEAAYGAWRAVIAAKRDSDAEFDNETRRLNEQGALLLGAVRSADGPGSGTQSLAQHSELQKLHRDAKDALQKALAVLTTQQATATKVFDQALIGIRQETQRRIELRCKLGRPSMKLMLRVLGADSRILHAERPSAEQAVTLMFALAGRIPSRFDYLFDDSSDDVMREPPVVYADENVKPDQTHPNASELARLLTDRKQVWPLKGSLPQVLPMGPLIRWRSRGPVLEAEIADGANFRNVLTAAEAELIAGHLLSLKLSGAINFELVRG